jgi:GxxExxY protein
MAVHSALGPGLLESAYEACLCREFSHRGIAFERQVVLPVAYRGLKLDCGYRLDLAVSDRAIVEVKAVDSLAPIHRAQLLTYLRLSGKRLGLLINFNVCHLRDGVMRVVV